MLGCQPVREAQLFSSARASVRRAHAFDWLRAHGRSERLLLLLPSSEAAGELVRDLAARDSIAAGFGWQRLSLQQLASTIATPELARRGLAPIGGLSLEALCARLLHESARQGKGHAGSRATFDPSLPGAARALAKTLSELRLAAIEPERVAPAKPELAELLAALSEALVRGRFADRALQLEIAAAEAGKSELSGHPLLLLDVPITSAREARFVAALAGRAPVTAIVPEGDLPSLSHLSQVLDVAAVPLAVDAASPLARMQERLFAALENKATAVEVSADSAGALEVFSAPGEGRECVEIVRRVLAAASGGVPFDRMAVLLRQPGLYRPLLEEALARAQIPAWFARGTSRPDPSGRAFLSLLACADEGLSARRFAEYLSLGEVPATGAPLPAEEFTPAEAGAQLLAPAIERAAQEANADAATEEPPARPSWRWEPLLIDAAVIGGREVEDAKGRWKRRLAKHREELTRQENENAVEDEAKAKRARSARDDLDALWSYAEPLLEKLASLPREESWGVWLAHLKALASSSLRKPERVLSLLAQLAPLEEVGPVSLAEVQLLVARELGELPEPPSARRAGKLFVGPIEAARGRSFARVFAPGLAERLFPPKALQDPLLRDRDRAPIDEALATEAQRVSHERLQLRLAAGAAEESLVLSWPRLELALGRARVPSFYALEAIAAAEGSLPGFDELSRRAERAGDARAGWPAPRAPRDAIDAAEYDLALLGDALRKPEAETRGTGRYLLGANPALRRALHRRAERARRKWFPSDGLIDPSPEAREALKAHQLDARSFSASALQNYSGCPYKFFLQAIHRLEPREERHAIDEIDPMSRGSLTHEIQFELFQSLQSEGVLPLFQPSEAETGQRLEAAFERLDAVSERVAERYRDELAPAIARVWQDCIASIRSDLREWLRRVAQEARWIPFEFERSFGLADRGARDAHSQTAPVQLAGGLKLRGSIDLVERDAGGELRATDYKGGRQRAEPGIVIKGGEVLQPMLYALAIEQLFPGAKVVEGQLYYCTHAGDYVQVPVPLDQVTRDAQVLLAKTVGDALREGFFPAAPRKGECSRCDYVEICGEGEEKRTANKQQERLLPLHTLRGSP